MDIVEITSPDDPRLDDFRDLATADRRPDRPGGRGLVIAEGVVVVRRLFASPYPVRAILGIRRRVEELASDMAGGPGAEDVAGGIPGYVVEPGLMAEVVGFHLNRGVLATADRAPMPTADELLAANRTVAVLEGVGDHENLGSLFRSAAALGIGGVLLGPGCADPLYRRSVRVSMGTVLQIPMTGLPGTLSDWAPAAAELLHRHGYEVVALTPDPAAVPLTAAGLAGRRAAVLLGSEGPGLTAAALAAADLRVRIPMARGVDSLNVATAGAITFAALDAASG